MHTLPSLEEEAFLYRKQGDRHSLSLAEAEIMVCSLYQVYIQRLSSSEEEKGLHNSFPPEERTETAQFQAH